jgi:hypothetical protein
MDMRSAAYSLGVRIARSRRDKRLVRSDNLFL